MWIVTLYDSTVSDCLEVLIFDLEELQKVLDFVGDHNDRFDVMHVEKRWMYCGLSDLQEFVGNDFGNEIPDKV